MRDPRPEGEFQASSARAADIDKHLGASLSSDNAYERLRALEYVGAHPDAVSADEVTPLAALIADRTKVLSLQCMRCQVSCALCDGCWGRQGNSDCGWLREVRDDARGPLTTLARGPQRVLLADALWTIALRSDADAAAVAGLMPAFGEALRARVRAAVDGPHAAQALRLLVRFPPGQCGDDQLVAALSRRMADDSPAVRARAALAILVCGDGRAAWTNVAPSAVKEVVAALADPRGDVIEEIPAVASIVTPLVGAIGARMSNHATSDGPLCVRLLQAVPAAAAGALPGLRARLLVSDPDESADLLMLIAQMGPRAASLKSAVITCARRSGAAYWAIMALGSMRASLSEGERDALKRAYVRACRLDDDCSPFAQVMAEAFGRPAKR